MISSCADIWPRVHRRWNRAHNEYACDDGVRFACRPDAVETGSGIQQIAVRNGIQRELDMSVIPTVAETVLNRDMTELRSGCSSKTFTLPKTVRTVCQHSFKDRR